jgi:PAS domain S-box-containing protein
LSTHPSTVSRSVVVDPSDEIRILHVDDDVNQSEFLQYFLPAMDDAFKIDSVSDPCQVFEKMESERYDCVVTDYQMPKMNGIELAEKIRESFNLPIIIYTGQGSEEVAEAAFSAGIDDYLRKEMDPSHYQVLAKRIRNVVEKKRVDTLYRTVIEQTRDALLIFVDNRAVYANQALLDLLGIEDMSGFGADPFHFFMEGDRERAAERLKQVLTHGYTPGFFRYRLKRNDGQTIHVDVSTSPVTYNGKKGIICFARDVTETVRLEEEKKETQLRLQSLVSLAPDGICTVDLTGTVTSVNAAFSVLTGFDENEIVGKNLLMLPTLRKTDFREHLRLFRHILRGQMPPPFQLVYQRKDGTTGWAEIHGCFIDIQGKKEILAVIREISDRKMREQEKEEYNKHLETLVTQRKNELIDTERLIAEGIMSQLCDELNTPLTDLNELIGSLKNNPGTFDKILPAIEKQVGTSLELIQEITSRVGDTPLALEKIEIELLIKKALEDCDVPDSIKVEVDHKDVSYVVLDPEKMKRVITKLVSNSVDAMPRGGEISISAEMMGGELVLEVRDTGGGMNPNLLKNIFKPFYTTKKDGIGLGLVYCKKAVEEHGGSISVESETGKGTSVSIRLPMLTPTTSIEYPYLESHNYLEV